jgi:hypothetical protein
MRTPPHLPTAESICAECICVCATVEPGLGGLGPADWPQRARLMPLPATARTAASDGQRLRPLSLPLVSAGTERRAPLSAKDHGQRY